MDSGIFSFRNIRECLFDLSVMMEELEGNFPTENVHGIFVTAYLSATFLDPNISIEMKDLIRQFEEMHENIPQETSDIINDIIAQQLWEDKKLYETEERHILVPKRVEITTA